MLSVGLDDKDSFIFLAMTTPSWLPAVSNHDYEFVRYSPQRIRRQFGLDQGIPSLSSTVGIPKGYGVFVTSEVPNHWAS